MNITVRSRKFETEAIIYFNGRHIHEWATFISTLEDQILPIDHRSEQTVLLRIDQAELRHGILRVQYNRHTGVLSREELDSIIEHLEFIVFQHLVE